MNEEFLGGQERAELAQPQEMSGATNTAAEAQPQGRDVDNMSEEDFLSYLGNVSDGSLPDEVRKEAEEPGEEKPFAVFNTQEDYQKDFDERFNKRFRGQKERLEAFEDVLNVGHGVYGDGDEKEILERIKQDVLNAAAAEQGKDPGELNGEIELRSKASAYDRIVQKEQEKNDIIGKWINEAESLKAQIPDFDFDRAMKNPDFYKSIVDGKSVAESYIGAYLSHEKQKPVRSISQNAAQSTQSSAARHDPSSLSDEEFEKYIKKCKGI